VDISLIPGGIVAWIIAGLIAGWLAGLLVRGRGFGCLGDIVLGIIGAFVGAFVISFLPLNIDREYHFIGTVIVAFIGALILAAIGRLIGGPRRGF
jgi:uncharacterized membrane protein YeaQ/YmgE (transglycosylase-associated protein family)